MQIWALTLGARYLWEWQMKAPEGEYYPPYFNWLVAPGYALIFSLLLWASGAYRRPYRMRSIVSASFAGFIAIATMSYIFKEINFSRAIVMLVSGGTLLTTL